MWLLEPSVNQARERAEKAGLRPTAEQRQEWMANVHARDAGSSSRILSLAGRSAEIEIKGVMTPEPDLFAMIFGGGNTTYSEIRAALAEAESDPEVEDITLTVDSPGGTVAGLFETIAALQAVKKPMRAVVSGVAASAAFSIVTQANEIVATNRAASFGSVGVVVSMFADEDIIDITSTEAPNKRPDPTTEEGQAVIREHLDELHEVFVDAIASGRGTTAEKVNADFGRGGMFAADKALKRGMIDRIESASLRAVPSTQSQATARDGGEKPEIGLMDVKTLKAQHPDVYAAVVQEGEEKALNAERDRVSAFLTAGEMSGDMKTAIEAVKSGDAMTQTLSMKFMMASANRGNLSAREQDEAAAAAAADGANGASADDDKATQDTKASQALLGALGERLHIEVGV